MDGGATVAFDGSARSESASGGGVAFLLLGSGEGNTGGGELADWRAPVAAAGAPTMTGADEGVAGADASESGAPGWRREASASIVPK